MTKPKPTRTLGELKQKQSLPLEAKVAMSQERIRQWYDYWEGNVFVSFSGGKDSTVLLHMVRELYPEVPAVFADTGLEFPEIRELVKTVPNVTFVRPEMPFKQVIETYGYPVVSKEVADVVAYAKKGRPWALNKLAGLDSRGEPSRWNATRFRQWAYLVDAPFPIGANCCGVMKKKPMHRYQQETGRRPYLGTLACESAIRQTAWTYTGCNAYTGAEHSTPMAFWLEQDVLRYIREKCLPIASVYGDIVEDDNGQLKTTGRDRTGCMFCMFGAHREKSPNRFEQMRETHPKIYDYCMRETGLDMDRVLTWLGVPH